MRNFEGYLFHLNIWTAQDTTHGTAMNAINIPCRQNHGGSDWLDCLETWEKSAAEFSSMPVKKINTTNAKHRVLKNQNSFEIFEYLPTTTWVFFSDFSALILIQPTFENLKIFCS